MRNRLIQLASVFALVAVSAYGPATARLAGAVETSPSLSSIGPLTFAPDGTLYAADPQAATIFALDLGASANGGAPGTASVAGIDQKIAAMLGTDAKEIAITDLAVHPRTHNSFVAVMRGQGASAKPALLRIDGAGKVELVATDSLKASSVTLPNPPAANAARNARRDSITKLQFANGRVWVAGLSNEEFASKLWSVAYPFTKADNGTSVEIYHGNHQQLETRSPVYAFIPYTIDSQPYIIGAYLCTPLVKFPVSALAPGARYRGTTIAELGAGNRPIDMVLYKKNGKEFLLMSNTSRGVMKIPTADFATAAPITAPVTSETAGVAYEKITSMTGIQQLDLLDATHSVVIATASAGLNLTAAELP